MSLWFVFNYLFLFSLSFIGNLHLFSFVFVFFNLVYCRLPCLVHLINSFNSLYHYYYHSFVIDFIIIIPQFKHCIQAYDPSTLLIFKKYGSSKWQISYSHNQIIQWWQGYLECPYVACCWTEVNFEIWEDGQICFMLSIMMFLVYNDSNNWRLISFYIRPM